MSTLDESVLAAPDKSRGGALTRLALALIVVGGVLTAIALLQEEARNRLSYAYLIAFVFVWAIVLGSVFFVALQHVTGSVWSVVLRRVAEMLASPMWLMVLLFVPLVLFAVFYERFTMFPWANPDVVKGDELLEHKAPYLSVSGFAIRNAIFFLIWVVFAAVFVRRSLGQDATSEDRTSESNVRRTLGLRRIAGPFMVLFGFTVTFAAFDWLMSLEPKWYSTIFGVYVFSGMVVTALAAITLAVLWARGKGYLGKDVVRPDHLYSLGALLFAFTCFWAYIAFSQYMLIWYANIPEETVYFWDRMQNGWGAVTIVLALLRFAVPFFLLLSRDAKSDPRRLILVSVLVLLGQLVDLYWLVMPQAPGEGALPTWQDLGPLFLLVGVLALYLGFFVRRHRLVPVGDPQLDKSRMFHL